MKQLVLKLNYHDDRARKKILKTVSGHSGVESISLDSKDMKLTVTGDIDPVSLVSKLRKLCTADILSVGPKKEAEKKKEEPKKPEAKKPDEKKDNQKDDLEKLLKTYQEFYMKYPPVTPQVQYYRTIEEDPNACVIC